MINNLLILGLNNSFAHASSFLCISLSSLRGDENRIQGFSNSIIKPRHSPLEYNSKKVHQHLKIERNVTWKNSGD